MEIEVLPEFIQAKIQLASSGCWEWTGPLSSGYGNISKSKKRGIYTKLAHKAVYEIVQGKVKSGLELDHLCRNRKCCNPEHLEPVTHKENCRRGDAGKYYSNRTHCKNGHEFTPENTRIRVEKNKGMWSRVCLVCSRKSGREHMRKRRLEFKQSNPTPEKKKPVDYSAICKSKLRKTHCFRGHEYTPETSALSNKGWRYCRICNRENVKRSTQKKSSPAQP